MHSIKLPIGSGNKAAYCVSGEYEYHVEWIMPSQVAFLLVNSLLHNDDVGASYDFCDQNKMWELKVNAQQEQTLCLICVLSRNYYRL